MRISKNYPLYSILITFCCFFSLEAIAQKSQGIGTNTPNTRAVLDINAEQPNAYPQGVLMPRLTTIQRNSLGTVSGLAVGMTVFDADLIKYFYWNGSAWVQIAEAAAIASYFTFTGNNIRTLNNSDNIQLASTSGAYLIGTNTGLRMTDNGNVFVGAHNTTFTGEASVFIGSLAGLNANAPGPTRAGVFIGFKAGQNNTAIYNSFIGYESGMNNTSGTTGTFFGYQAGKANTTGSDNTFMGFAAGRSLNGTGNTFYGNYIGQSQISGSNNSYFGNNTARSVSGGSNNAYFGDNVASNSTGGTANNNSFFGAQSGYSNTGINNVFVGYQSGYGNTSGANNAFLGYLSGTNNTTGTNNIAIGNMANFLINNSSNSIAIGSLTSTSGSNQVVIGNAITGLGINVNTPTTMLDVNGGARIRSLSISGSVLTVDNLGNLGMGTIAATPNYFTFTGGNIITLNNSDNIQLASTSGAYLIGTNTGLRMDNNNSVYIGNFAGNNTTTGANNNFIGELAGRGNTTGLDNNFLGREAGRFNTTGNYNNYLGNSAGRSNTSGQHNNFLGQQSGFNNLVGGFNNFLGVQTGFANTNGNYNNFLGFQTGYANTSGSSNVFMGYHAGRLNTIGNGNIFLGSIAGYNNLSGNNNIILGSNSDFSANNFSNSIVIGSNATVGGSNMMMLGGVGANSLKVGIGTSLPGATLHVAGNLRVESLSISGSVLTVDGLGNLGMGVLATQPNYWEPFLTDRIYTTSFVGVGTSTPGYPLHVVVGNTIDNAVYVNKNVQGTTGNQVAYSAFFNGVPTSGTKIGYESYITPTGSESVRGMTSTIINNVSNNNLYAAYSYISNNGNGQSIAVNAINDGTGSGTHTGFFAQDNSTGTGERYGVFVNMSGTGGGTNYAIYGKAIGSSSGNYSGYFDDGLFYVKSFVGINVVNPTTFLDVNGGVRFRTLNTTGAVLTVDGAGNVGMGTISTNNSWVTTTNGIYAPSFVGIGNVNPYANLHISNPTFSNMRFTTTVSGETATDGIEFGLYANQDFKIANRESNGDIIFEINGNEKMRVSQFGNVSINNTISGMGALVVKPGSSMTAILAESNNSGTPLKVSKTDDNPFGQAMEIGVTNFYSGANALTINNSGTGIGINMNLSNSNNQASGIKLEYVGTGKALEIKQNSNVAIEPAASITHSTGEWSSPALLLNRNSSIGIGLELVNGGIKLDRSITFTGFAGSTASLGVNSNGEVITLAGNSNSSFWLSSATNSIYTSSTVGIGLTTPGFTTLQVSGDDTNPAAVGLLNAATSIGVQGGFVNLRSNSSSKYNLGAVQSGQSLGTFGFAGYDGSTFASNGPTAEMRATATQNFTGSDQGTSLTFATTPNNSNSSIDRMMISENGFIGIGTSTPSQILHVLSNSTLAGIFEGTNASLTTPILVTVKNSGAGSSGYLFSANNGNSSGLIGVSPGEIFIRSIDNNLNFLSYGISGNQLSIFESGTHGRVIFNTTAVGIRTSTFTGFEALRINSTNSADASKPKGLVFPYVTTAQMATLTVGGLSSLDAGMAYFNTDTKNVEIWDGTQWQSKGENGGGNGFSYQDVWGVGGNTILGFGFITATGYGKLGSNDAMNVALITNNQPRILVNTVGGVGIGFSSNVMKSTLQVNGDLGLGDGIENGNKPIVVWLRNISGSTVNPGRIVIASPTTDDAFTTTNIAQDNSAIGILTETCNNNQTCKVAISGIVEVFVSTGITRGQHCVTSTLTGEATSVAIPNAGASIGIFIADPIGPTARVLLR
jgi:hypothetical protein